MYSCVGKVGDTAHPTRLKASPVSHVAMNARETPSLLRFRQFATICGSSATPHATMLTHPSTKDVASRREQTQSPKYLAAKSHESQVSGHAVADIPAADRTGGVRGGGWRVVRRPFERLFARRVRQLRK